MIPSKTSCLSSSCPHQLGKAIKGETLYLWISPSAGAFSPGLMPLQFQPAFGCSDMPSNSLCFPQSL